MAFSTKVALLTFAVLWVVFNIVVFPTVPRILLQEAEVVEGVSSLFYVTIVYCLVPSVIIYVISRVIEYVLAKMAE